MSQINFLHKDEAEKKKAEAVRAMVLPITTAVMVIYLVTVSALLGWRWWWSSKQVRVSTEYATLKGQVDSKQQAEVLAKRMIDRVKIINTYLNSRKDIYGETEFLADQPYTVKQFGLAKEGYFFVEVTASESGIVTALEGDLKRLYSDVMVKSMGWNKKDNSWSVNYWYRNKKT